MFGKEHGESWDSRDRDGEEVSWGWSMLLILLWCGLFFGFGLFQHCFCILLSISFLHHCDTFSFVHLQFLQRKEKSFYFNLMAALSLENTSVDICLPFL